MYVPRIESVPKYLCSCGLYEQIDEGKAKYLGFGRGFRGVVRMTNGRPGRQSDARGLAKISPAS